MRLADLPTPALVVNAAALDANIATMAERWPGTRLRPHVKAFKSTALARKLVANGHTGLCTATVSEAVGLAEAGLGTDLLIANEVPDPRRLESLADLVRNDRARITIAVDSTATIDAAVSAGLTEVLIDINVGLPRCGCAPADAARLAERARSAGLEVRGTMGYEGHTVGIVDRAERSAQTEVATEILERTHAEVGGSICSGGGTGTWDLNTAATELQAGSYTLMDTAYAELDLPFRQAVAVLGTVISVTPGSHAVADVGLKALGMDHGNPAIDDGDVWFCSDEHLTFAPARQGGRNVGDRIWVWPAHIDPTVAKHEYLYVVDQLDQDEPRRSVELDLEVIDRWPIDLRHW